MAANENAQKWERMNSMDKLTIQPGDRGMSCMCKNLIQKVDGERTIIYDPNRDYQTAARVDENIPLEEIRDSETAQRFIEVIKKSKI